MLQFRRLVKYLLFKFINLRLAERLYHNIIWREMLQNKKPNIAILGLNPHNFSFSKKSEEKEIIAKAVKSLIKSKIIFRDSITNKIFC